MADIRLTDNRTLPSLLKPNVTFTGDVSMAWEVERDYNTYYEGKPEQLNSKDDKDGGLVIDGLLNIYWGLRTAIRLQVADDMERIRPLHREDEEDDSKDTLNIPDTEGDVDNPGRGKARRGMGLRLNKSFVERKVFLPHLTETSEPKGRVLRINSVVMRKKGGRQLRYRASINGHSYNYQTSVFTPAFGSVTKVRVSSQNNANDVIIKLLNKFRVENSPDDFSFYVVKETKERRELPRDEVPLVSRVLLGPNEKLGKIFLMERKMHKEISPEVAQYVNLDTSILHVFLKKFQEEEEIEVKKLRKRFEFYKEMLNNRIKEVAT